MYNYTEKQLKWLNDNGFVLSDVSDNLYYNSVDCAYMEIDNGKLYMEIAEVYIREADKLKEYICLLNKYYELANEWESELEQCTHKK